MTQTRSLAALSALPGSGRTFIRGDASIGLCNRSHAQWRKLGQTVVRTNDRDCRVSDELAIRGASEICSATSQPARSDFAGTGSRAKIAAAAPLTKNFASEVVAQFPSYVALIHVGTNVAGRAVQSPVDGIGLHRHRGGRRLLLVQHTITARKALRRKWLTPAKGDVATKLTILAAEQKRGEVRAATLVLCSTADADEELIRDVHEAAGAAVAVDIWPGSRIADFLDRHPEGQWLRQCAFGTAAVRLSLSQGRAIARQSLDNYLPLFPRDEMVARARSGARRVRARCPRHLVRDRRLRSWEECSASPSRRLLDRRCRYCDRARS